MHRSTLVRSAFRSLAALALVASLTPAVRAVDFPAPSPGSTLKQRVGLTDVEINYSRPGVKNRQIFGALVPHGKVWRTGANAATTISFSTPVVFGGAEVPAGRYALYTIPGENEWTVILSKKTDLWGSFGYDPKDDFVRVPAKPVRLPQVVETLTIDINDVRDESATLHLEWENTRVAVKLEVHFVAQLAQEIETTMAAADPKKPYFQAAMFFYDHNLDLQKAKTWVEVAESERSDGYWILHLKAKILAKLGDKAGAIAAAKRSRELAEGNGDSSYVKSNNDLLATLQ